MKAKIWILIVGFLILAGIAVGAATIFYATSNVDKYRPLLEKNLSAALGNTVRIQGISMKWSGGLAVEARDLVVFEGSDSVIKVRSAAMKLDPWALLSKRLVIRSIEIIEPQATLTRKSDGTVAVMGVEPGAAGKSEAGSPSAAVKAGAGGMGSWSLLIENIRIKGAHVTFVDESVKPARTAVIRSLDAEARNVSLDGPVTFKAQAAIFGDKQNVSVSGKVSELRGGRPKLENVEAKLNFDLIDTAQLAKFVPQTVTIIDGPLIGQLTVRVPDLVLGRTKTPEFTAQAELTGGSARLRALRPKIDRVDVKIQATRQTAELESATVALAGGEIKVKGKAIGYDTPATGGAQLDLTAQGLKIENFLERDKSAKTLLEGEVGGSFAGTAVGLDAASIQKTLGGKLAFDFPKGILLNYNIVREVLGKMGTMFPNLIQEVEMRLPQAYREQLTSRSTILKPLHHEFEVRDGAVLVRNLTISTDFFSASLSGDLKLDGNFDGKGSIQLDNTFSNAFFEGKPELKTLANAASRVELPFIVTYHNGKLVLLPDLEEIGRRLIQKSGQELLSQFLSGVKAAASSKSSAAGSESASATTSTTTAATTPTAAPAEASVPAATGSGTGPQ